MNDKKKVTINMFPKDHRHENMFPRYDESSL